jgi:MFS family permease
MATLFPTAKSDPELYPFRSGLVFEFFNALTWQIAIGTPMVLFAERLGASSFQVGLAYSFAFLLTPVQVLATALLPRYGFKQVSMRGWAARSLFLALPLALALLAPEIGRPWMVNVLIWSVFFFSLCRSVGAAAMMSWFYGLVPSHLRGRYFASAQMLSGLAGAGTLVTCALLFAFMPIYTALLIQYAISFSGSVLSYFALNRLPDIAKPPAISLRTVLRDTPRHMFAPSRFRHYLWLSAWFAVIATPIPPFSAYFLKVGPQLTPGRIMLFEVLRYLGVIAGAWLIRRRIDHSGAKPFFLLALVLYAGVGGLWWLYLHSLLGGGAVLFGIYFLVGLGAVCWNVANLNYLPKVVPVGERALFVSIHGAVTACIGGCSPIWWGLFLKSTGTNGAPGINATVFQWFFVSVLVNVSILALLVARLHEDPKTRVEPLVIGNALLRPFRAASYLVNLIDLQSLGREPGRPPNSPPG